MKIQRHRKKIQELTGVWPVKRTRISSSTLLQNIDRPQLNCNTKRPSLAVSPNHKIFRFQTLEITPAISFVL